MGVNYFTEEQVKELYWIDYQNGIRFSEIFKKYVFVLLVAYVIN